MCVIVPHTCHLHTTFTTVLHLLLPFPHIYPGGTSTPTTPFPELSLYSLPTTTHATHPMPVYGWTSYTHTTIHTTPPPTCAYHCLPPYTCTAFITLLLLPPAHDTTHFTTYRFGTYHTYLPQLLHSYHLPIPTLYHHHHFSSHIWAGEEWVWATLASAPSATCLFLPNLHITYHHTDIFYYCLLLFCSVPILLPPHRLPLSTVPRFIACIPTPTWLVLYHTHHRSVPFPTTTYHLPTTVTFLPHTTIPPHLPACTCTAWTEHSPGILVPAFTVSHACLPWAQATHSYFLLPTYTGLAGEQTIHSDWMAFTCTYYHRSHPQLVLPIPSSHVTTTHSLTPTHLPKTMPPTPCRHFHGMQ